MQQKQEIKLVTQGRKFLLINSDLQKRPLKIYFVYLCHYVNLTYNLNVIQYKMRCKIVYGKAIRIHRDIDCWKMYSYIVRGVTFYCVQTFKVLLIRSKN